MAFNFMERLGSMLGQSVASRLRGAPQAEPAPAEADAPAPEAAAEAPVAAEPMAAEPVAEAPAFESYTAPAEAATAPSEPIAYAAPSEVAPEPVSSAPSDAATTADASATLATADAGAAVADAAAPEAAVAAPEAAEVSFAAPTEVAPTEVAAEAAPAEPSRSAEELEEERLWGEVEAAWAGGDFQKVTESLDRLRELQPEDAAVIDEKIAAAQYNQAAAFEQGGDLERALYLYQEAQRRNPALGEATFAIERVQAALQPPPTAEAPAAEPEPAAPAEQSYTVADGDTLWAIAERFYGDGSQYPRIFEANRDQLENPDVIQPGQVLRIPA